MGKIVVNKHVDDRAQVSPESFVNKGEIIVSNQVGEEGIFIINKDNNTVFIGTSNGSGTVAETDHVFLSSSEYQTLITNGSAVVNGVTIFYDDNTYYAIYDDAE